MLLSFDETRAEPVEWSADDGLLRKATLLLIALFKGVVYQDQGPETWQSLLAGEPGHPAAKEPLNNSARSAF